MPTRSAVEQLMPLVAGHGFGEQVWPEGPIPEDEWALVLSRIVSERLTGVAVAAVQDQAFRVTPEQRLELVDEHRRRMVRVLMLERKLLGLVDALDHAGVSAVVLKGTALARTVYPDASWRDFGDVDLLVASADFARASAVLVELGHTRRLSEPRPGFVERFGKAAVHVGPDLVEVDLHRTLVLGPYALWVDADALISRTVAFDLAGRSLRCLSPEHQLVHACMHAVLGTNPPRWQPRFLSMRDVVQVARAAPIDEDAFHRDVSAWGLGPVVAMAAQYVHERLRLSVPRMLAPYAGRVASRREQRVMVAYVGPGREEGSTSTSLLRAIPRLLPKLAYVRAVLLPDNAFLADLQTWEAGTGIRRYWTRWAGITRMLVRRARQRWIASPAPPTGSASSSVRQLEPDSPNVVEQATNTQ